MICRLHIFKLQICYIILYYIINQLIGDSACSTFYAKNQNEAWWTETCHCDPTNLMNQFCSWNKFHLTAYFVPYLNNCVHLRDKQIHPNHYSKCQFTECKRINNGDAGIERLFCLSKFANILQQSGHSQLPA